jgi:steroid delta-isomerase-like uncharacterized protein
MQAKTQELIRQYYDAFNQQDMERFLSLLDPDVVHHINQGKEEHGKDAFAAFMQRMAASYREHVSSLVIMTNDDGSHASAEFIVEGKYLSTDAGLPHANGQTYRLPCGTFFSIRHHKITRVTNYYNLQHWLDQVSTTWRN